MFEKFVSLEHLYVSFDLAYKGRNKTNEVIKYQQNLEENLLNLRKKLITFEYKHSSYFRFIVKDSKKRVINAPSFEDHILHHALFFLLNKIFEKKFIFHSYANRIGKGSHRAVLVLRQNSLKYEYFLKMDISKFFMSIDKSILYSQIRREVFDEKFLNYIKLVLDSYDEGVKWYHIFDFRKYKFTKLNFLSPFSFKTGKGIPIGNITSQLFANIYLHDLDFYVEHTIKPKFRKEGKKLFYIRYVDDFLFLSKAKLDLKLLKEEILDFLRRDLLLSVSPKKLVLNKITCGIPFLGYVVFKNRIKVKNDTIRRFKKKIKSYNTENKLNSLTSFKGHCDLANRNLIKKISTLILLNDKEQ